MEPPRPKLHWIFASLNVALGLIPSLAFFVWIERNCTLPWIAIALHWPWIHLEEYSLPILLFWNGFLIALFGLIHSLLAQPQAQLVIQKLGFPENSLRALYMIATGIAATLVMALWQNTGIILWSPAFLGGLPHALLLINLLSIILFWSFFSGIFWVIKRFGLRQFVGLGKDSQASNRLTPSQVHSTGIYGWIRHPIYFLGALAILLTPVMSLDRASLLIYFGIYLVWGIRLEEKKLIQQFGEHYREYQRKVPAVFPRLKNLNRGGQSL